MALGALFSVTATITHRLIVLLTVFTGSPTYGLTAALATLIGFLILSSTFSWYLVAVIGASLLQAIIQMIAQRNKVPDQVLTTGKLLKSKTIGAGSKVVAWDNLISLLALFSGSFLLVGASMVATYKSSVDETEAIALGSTFLGLGAAAFAIIVTLGCCCYRRSNKRTTTSGKHLSTSQQTIWDGGLPAQLKYWFLVFLLLSGGFIIQESTRSATVSGIGSDISFVWHLITTLVLWGVFAGISIALKLNNDPFEKRSQVGWFVLINAIHDVAVVILGQSLAYALRNDSNVDLYTMVGFVSGSGAFALIDLLWIIFDKEIQEKVSDGYQNAKDSGLRAGQRVVQGARNLRDRVTRQKSSSEFLGSDVLMSIDPLGYPSEESRIPTRSRSQSRGRSREPPQRENRWTSYDD